MTSYLFDDFGVETTGIEDLIYSTILIAHVREFIFAGSKANGGNSHTHRRDRVGAEIPKIKILWFASENFAIGGDAGLGQFVVQVDLPGCVEGIVTDVPTGPAFAMKRSHFPGGVFAADEFIHFLFDVLIRFAWDSSAIQIDFTFRWDGIQRGADAGDL